MGKTPTEKAPRKARRVRAQSRLSPSDQPVGNATPQAPELKSGDFAVLNAKGAYVRTYTALKHGDEAEGLAKQYADKIGGTVQ